MKNKFLGIALGTTLLGTLALSLASCKTDGAYEFAPSQDTNITTTLNIKGFFGNFEALDKLKADFKYYYPNVTIDYSDIPGPKLSEFLDTNENNDIFMVSLDTLSSNVIDHCLDLSTANIYLNDIDNVLLKANYVNNKLCSIPIGQNVYGLVVNKTLLSNNGLKLPTTYSEFLNCLSTLNDKGYVPVQSDSSKLYTELTFNMMANLVLNNKNISFDDINNIYNIVDEVMPYTSKDVNATYPSDNYDGAIKNFFHGDVPFWVCNSEKVSGMKKREKKWEDFSNNPFEYTYINAPIAKDGSYAYNESWVGFSINNQSKNIELAKDFMRLLSTSVELNNMANIKRIPSVAKIKKSLDIYYNIDNPTKIVSKVTNDGSLSSEIITSWYSNMNNYINEKITRNEAINNFVSCVNNN